MDFPAHIPTSRSYTPPKWPVDRFKMMSGRHTRQLTSTDAYSAKLRLVYANVSGSDMQQFMQHYDVHTGTAGVFKFPQKWITQVWGGWDQKKGDEKRLTIKGKWRYAAPPRFTQTNNRAGTVEVALINVPGHAPPGVCLPPSSGIPYPGDPGPGNRGQGGGGQVGSGSGGGSGPGGGGSPSKPNQPTPSKPYNPGDPSTWPPAPDNQVPTGPNTPHWPDPVIQPPGQPPQPPPGDYPKVPPKPYDPDGLGCWKPLSTLCSWEPNGPGCDSYGCGGCVEMNCGGDRDIVGITSWYYKHTKLTYNCPVCRYLYRDALHYTVVVRKLRENNDDTVTISYETKSYGPLWVFPNTRTYWLETPLTCDRLGPREITPVETACWMPPGYTKNRMSIYKSIDEYIKEFPERAVPTNCKEPFDINEFTSAMAMPYGIDLTPPPIVYGEDELGNIWDDGNLPWPGYPDLDKRPEPEPAPQPDGGVAVDFPLYNPSRRGIRYGEWNTKRFTQSPSAQERITPLSRQAQKYDVILELTYANRPDQVARDFLRHYLESRGAFSDFKLPKEKIDKGPMAGWKVPDADRYLSKGNWNYLEAPTVTSVHPGTSSVTVQLVTDNPREGPCDGGGSGSGGGSSGPGGGRPSKRPPGPGAPISPYPDPDKVYPSPLPPSRPPIDNFPDPDNPVPPGSPGSGDPGEDDQLQPSPPWIPDPPRKEGLYNFYMGYTSYVRKINLVAGKYCNNPGNSYDDEIFVSTEPQGIAVQHGVPSNSTEILDLSGLEIIDNGPKPLTYVEKDQYTAANNYSHRVIYWTLNGEVQIERYKTTGLSTAGSFQNCVVKQSVYTWWIPTTIRYQYRDIGMIQGTWRLPCSWYGRNPSTWSCAPGAEEFKLGLGQYPEFLGWTDPQGNPVDPTTGERI